MRPPTHRASLLTVIPFAAVMLAESTSIRTRVEDDGTGVRSVEVSSNADRKDLTRKHVERHLLPSTEGRRLDRHSSSTTYTIEGDIRFTRPKAIGGLRIARHTRFGGWPPINVVYEYSDTITRTDYSGTKAEEAAAPETGFTYSVRMPGTISDDPTTIHPKDGVVDGQTVTWELSADKEELEVTVTSVEPAWALVVLATAIAVVVVLWVLKTVLAWRKNRPKRI